MDSRSILSIYFRYQELPISPVVLAAISLACLAIAYSQSKSVLHPHFMYTLIWVYLLPAGAILNPELPSYLTSSVTPEEVELANLTIIVLMCSIFFTTSLCIRSIKQARFNANTNDAVRVWSLIGCVGVALLFAQLISQLSSTDWSVKSWFDYTVGPRFGRPWKGGYVGGADFIRTFVNSLFNVSPLALITALSNVRGYARLVFSLALCFTFFLLVCDGSRTPVAMTIVAATAIWWSRSLGLKRFLGTAFGCIFFFLVTALMLNARQDGLAHTEELTFSYNQDDNYYRLIKVIVVADRGVADNWSALDFLTAAIVNPIPRYFWAGKPLLTHEFYGEWKKFYVTITAFGECVAMFGVIAGAIVSILVSVCSVRALYFSYERFTKPGGYLLYFGTAFYIYSINRSLYNMGMNAIFFALIVFTYYLMQKRQAAFK